MFLMKLKIVAALLGVSTSAYRQGRHDMVSRVAEDVYSVPGEGEVYTKGCSYTAKRQVMSIQESPDHRLWAVFLDDDGQEEANCELTFVRPTRTLPSARVILRDRPATVK